jgi:hypothetical protein
MISEINFERFLIINNRELTYKGIFRMDDLFSTINRAIEAQGYTKREKKSEETVREEGRSILIELRPWKEVTNYLTLMIKIKIIADNVTETVGVVNGDKRIYQNADLSIVFDGWLLTDYDNKWGMKPFFYFAKQMANKYLWKGKIETEIFGQLAGDVAHMYAHIKKHLNSYRGGKGDIVREEEVIKEIQKELEKDIAEAKKEVKLS